jgi:copper(I)-binding protein
MDGFEGNFQLIQEVMMLLRIPFLRDKLMLPMLFLLAAPALAQVASTPGDTAPASDGLVLSEGWFRSLPGDLPAAGYFTLHNTSARGVTLTGAQSPACGMVMLHQTSTGSGGMSSMAHVASLEVPAGGSVVFAPNGYHLMCMRPTAAMQVGATVPVTLLFQHGGQLTASFQVRSAAGN